MKRSILFALALLSALTLLPSAVVAEPGTTMSFQGYSGLTNTPTAELFSEGSVYIQYGNQVETKGGYRQGANYNFGAGLWKYVEVSARLADYNLGEKDGLTDLSANIKLGIPFIPKDWFSLAVGIQDLGGARSFFDAKYAVASKTIFEKVNVSLGIGRSDSLQGRLDGVFAGIAWQPYQWVKISGEYDAADTQLELHLSSPKAWFRSGIQLTTSFLLSSTNQPLNDDFYYGVGITIPLGFEVKKSTSRYKDNILKAATAQEYRQLDDLEQDIVDHSGTLERLRLKKHLVKEGFEAIKIGEADLNTIYIELENHIYNRNQIDGIGVALGIISTNIQHDYSHFKLVIKERELPILVVSGNLANYSAFLRENQPLNVKISTDTFASQRRIPTADLNNSNHYWLKPRFTFWPGIVSTVGTEVGVFDASIALVSHLELPLWRGAAVTAEHTSQLAETKYFEKGEIYAHRKQKTGLQQTSFHQTLALPYNLKNMTSFGRYRDTYNYLANEVRWQSIDGSHRLNLLTARYENQITPKRIPYAGCNILFVACWPPKEPQQRDVVIGKYRYYNANFDATAEIQVGQYWQQDKGVVFKLKRMFGDVSLSLTYKNTKVDNQESNQFIGLGFSIPLTPRKDFNHKYFQIRGKPNWQYSVNTLVGKDHNRLTPGSGDSAQLFYNLDSTFYNNDRLSKDYIYANQNRLKQAYFQAR